jgi:hypothetical protein
VFDLKHPCTIMSGYWGLGAFPSQYPQPTPALTYGHGSQNCAGPGMVFPCCSSGQVGNGVQFGLPKHIAAEWDASLNGTNA